MNVEALDYFINISENQAITKIYVPNSIAIVILSFILLKTRIYL